jgi:DMSO reductase anchor subunit
VGYLWCYLGCAYFSIGFILLSFEKFHHVYTQMYYYFHVLLVGSLLVFIAIKPKRKGKTE